MLSQSEQVIIDNYHTKMLQYLSMNRNQKIAFVLSNVISGNGITRSELNRIVNNVTQQFQNCLARRKARLQNISDRKKLVYRNYPNICRRH